MTGFGGDIPEYYQRYRRGYPCAVFDALAETFGLTHDDLVLDLGCGTGQLARPMANRVGAVLAMDPEPDMLARARRVATEPNVTWLLGADTDVPSLGGLLGGRLGAVTIGQALHWMDHEKLFPALSPLLRAGGGIAVVTNGEPLWLQDSDWSRSLKAMLEEWLGHPVQNACGTDFATQERYQAALAEAGYVVGTRTIEYAAELTVDQIAGGVFSAIPADRLPAREARPAFAERIRSAVGPYGPHIEDVRVRLLTGVHPG